jgi:hypothetical protein
MSTPDTRTLATATSEVNVIGVVDPASVSVAGLPLAPGSFIVAVDVVVKVWNE